MDSVICSWSAHDPDEYRGDGVVRRPDGNCFILQGRICGFALMVRGIIMLPHLCSQHQKCRSKSKRKQEPWRNFCRTKSPIVGYHPKNIRVVPILVPVSGKKWKLKLNHKKANASL